MDTLFAARVFDALERMENAVASVEHSDKVSAYRAYAAGFVENEIKSALVQMEFGMKKVARETLEVCLAVQGEAWK